MILFVPDYSRVITKFVASLLAQMAKNPLSMWVTLVQSLGWEDPLGESSAIHSSILAWRIPCIEELGRLQSTGLQSQTRPSD